MTREEFRGALSDIDEGGRLSHSEEARKAEILLLDHDAEQRAEIARLREALKEMVKAYNQLLPGISKIAVQDYANINEAPILAKQALKETS